MQPVLEHLRQRRAPAQNAQQQRITSVGKQSGAAGGHALEHLIERRAIVKAEALPLRFVAHEYECLSAVDQCTGAVARALAQPFELAFGEHHHELARQLFVAG